MQFYTAHVVYQTSLQHFAVVAIASLAESIIALSAHNRTGAVVAANQSMDALAELFAAQRRAEGPGQWRGLFAMDRLPYVGPDHATASKLHPVAGPVTQWCRVCLWGVGGIRFPVLCKPRFRKMVSGIAMRRCGLVRRG